MKMSSNFSPILLIAATMVLSAAATMVHASDWEEDSPKAGKSKQTERKHRSGKARRKKDVDSTNPETTSTEPDSSGKQYGTGPAADPASSSANDQQTGSNTMSPGNPLQGTVEQEGEASLRIQRPAADSSRTPDLSGAAREGGLTPMTPQSDANQDPLKGQAVLLGGKGARAMDPDQDDSELMVEWDRWRNRFLRAVQLGTQEIINNPDPDDYERPHIDPYTGAITSRYPLGTGAAFSCVITAQGQIKNLEIIEASGFPKYDRAVLKAVQQLAGTQIVHFPRGSHRISVVQPGRIKTATSSSFHYYHFGDVEHVQPRHDW